MVIEMKRIFVEETQNVDVVITGTAAVGVLIG